MAVMFTGKECSEMMVGKVLGSCQIGRQCGNRKRNRRRKKKEKGNK
jgi:hypothetical protein